MTFYESGLISLELLILQTRSQWFDRPGRVLLAAISRVSTLGALSRQLWICKGGSRCPMASDSDRKDFRVDGPTSPCR